MSGIQVFAVVLAAGQTAMLAMTEAPVAMFAGEAASPLVVLLTMFTLGGAALGPAFVYARAVRGGAGLACAAGAVAAGGGWLTLCVYGAGTREHGAGALLFMGGATVYTAAMLGAVAAPVEGFMLWYGMGLFLGGVSLWGQATGEMAVGAWFEWACALSHSAGMCAFYALHPFEGPLCARACEEACEVAAPLLREAARGDESWV